MIRFFLTLTLLLVCVTGFAQKENNNIDSLRKKWHAEVDFAAKSIQENSIDPLRGITQGEWDNGISEIHKKVNNAATRDEYYYALRYFGALIQDAHVEFPDEGVYNRNGIFKKTDTIFPIWVKSWPDYRVFAVRDFSNKIPKYSEIISINGVSATKIAFEQRKLMGSESRYAMYYTSSAYEGDPAAWTSFVNYLFCENIRSPFVVEYKIPNNDELLTTTLSGLERKEIHKLYKGAEGKDVVKEDRPAYFLFKFGKNNIAYNRLNDSIGVLQIKMFLNTGLIKYLFVRDDTNFPKMLEKCFKQIQEDGIKHLIIDLRDNKGGYRYSANELLACFTEEKALESELCKITDDNKKDLAKYVKSTYKIIYDKNHPEVIRSMDIFNSLPPYSLFKTDTLLSMQYTPKYKGYKYKNNVYLLINSGNYSASILFINLFRNVKLGVIAGESPGGYNVVSSGDGIIIDLPFSKIFSMKLPVTLTGTMIPDKYEYLKPDIPIEPTLEEWLYEKFNSLEVLVNMIKENKIEENFRQ